MAHNPLHSSGYNSRLPPPPPVLASHAPSSLAAHAGPNKENPFTLPHSHAYADPAKHLPNMPRVEALHPSPAPTYTPPDHRPLPPSPTKTTATATVNHYTRPLGGNSRAAQQSQQAEPTMVQLLASQGTAPAHYASRAGAGDVTMGNATGVLSWRKGQGFKEWEKLKLNSPEVKRKADVAQLFFYDHYFDLLTYVSSRKSRLASFQSSISSRPTLTPAEISSKWTSYTGRERVLLRKRRTKLKVDMFHVVTQVGQGGYGEVYLARHKETNQVVALKKMKKRTLAKMDEIRHVLVERDILASTSSPWLVRLLYAFQDPEHVFLAMDFIAGGDFRTLLNNSGVLKEEHARFYIAEMFTAVNELHKLGYIHRDLKPENFLIDTTGHIKLTDFGLAAGALNPGKIEHLKHKLDEVADSPLVFRSTLEMKSIYKSIRMADARYADSVVGSPDYMAIETLRGQSYSYSVDYWSLGCILFEFLAGFPPFSGATAEETWTNLKNWQRVLRRPHYERPEDRIFNLSDEGWDAITRLITHKDRRMSTLDQVKTHPFFRGVDWPNLRERKAPFIPALDSEIDAGYFDDFSSEADMAKYAEVREKQRHVDAVAERALDAKLARGVWVGFTFKAKKEEDRLLREKEHREKQKLQEEEEESLYTLF
ncbi:AGC/NDR protein kinase [Rhodotorula toruloides ATCC 204091]|uniref:non-specific serine/threonine protein kinase n=1 Tax=Rhodotorula toruloides TaxID=5286 RepID=A0A0K3CEV0_RHOTO|nr:AGC/NDR protein kinase [Rhodotorula toruloides ATCC 204091]KAK4336269.1 Serine/threonine-protein kinase DBF20 [Rhodotorula toruloides]PRQ74405.1 AGC/NDR protein kinase [Rhodotorula toruloides]